jgi:hypothetical protein
MAASFGRRSVTPRGRGKTLLRAARGGVLVADPARPDAWRHPHSADGTPLNTAEDDVMLDR